MNRRITRILGVAGIILCVSLLYYGMYCLTVRRLEAMQNDYENRMAEQVEIQVTKHLEKTAQHVVEKKLQEKEESVSASAGEDKLTVNTVYQIQKYDATKDTTTTEYDTLPADFVGCSREDVDQYCRNYMSKMSVEEFLDGLQSVGVVSYSKDRLVIKKIYDAGKVKYRYYLIAIDGEVVAYYGDKKTVYEYTGIETDTLSQKDRKELKKGIEVKDEEELYSILENYSS